MAAKRPTRKTAKKTASKKVKTKRAVKKTAVSEDRVQQIQRLIDVMVDAGAVEVEVEEAGSKIRVRLKEDPPAIAYTTAAPVQLASPLEPGAPAAAEGSEDEPLADSDVFKSPLVGTFYRAHSPDAGRRADRFGIPGQRIDRAE